jgi:hypothetical protein
MTIDFIASINVREYRSGNQTRRQTGNIGYKGRRRSGNQTRRQTGNIGYKGRRRSDNRTRRQTGNIGYKGRRRSDNQTRRQTGNIGYKGRRKTKQKHNIIYYVGHHYTQTKTKTNNVNKTCAPLHTTVGKNESNIASMWKS